MSDTFQDLIRAMEFAQGQFEQWAKDRTIGSGPLEAITKDYNQQRQAMNRMAREGRPLPSDRRSVPADKCWNCRAAVAAGQEHCAGCGVPVSCRSVQDLRYWTYTCHRIKAHCDAGRLPLAQAHACMNDAKSRIAAMRNRLEKDRVGEAVVAAEAVAEGGRRRAGRRGSVAACRTGRRSVRPGRRACAAWPLDRLAAPAAVGNHPRSAHDPMAAWARRRAVGGRAGDLAGDLGNLREPAGRRRGLGHRQRRGAGRRLGHHPLFPLSNGRPGHYLAGLPGDAAEPLVLPCPQI